MLPLVKAISCRPEFDLRVAVTGQHREMLDQVLTLFQVNPDYDLKVMSAGQDLCDITSLILTGLREVLKDFSPELVLVHGDTATTFSAALAAFFFRVNVAHVEAGLRTYDLQSPWPEEGNRQLVSRIAHWHFAPTDLNKNALIKEGVDEEHILVTGNTVIDSLLWVTKQIKESPAIREAISSELVEAGLFNPEQLGRYILVTGHRRESFGDGFTQICEALGVLATRYPKAQFVYPVHLNPNVQNPVKSSLGKFRNIHLIRPVSYAPFVWLMQNCHAVLTDSGGVQEEAPGLGKPVVVMRDTTERQEALEAGTVVLAGAKSKSIVHWISTLFDDQDAYLKMSRAHNPYGDGLASTRIANFLSINS